MLNEFLQAEEKWFHIEVWRHMKEWREIEMVIAWVYMWFFSYILNLFKTKLTGKQDRSFVTLPSILVGLSSLYFGYSFYKLFKNRQWQQRK